MTICIACSAREHYPDNDSKVVETHYEYDFLDRVTRQQVYDQPNPWPLGHNHRIPVMAIQTPGITTLKFCRQVKPARARLRSNTRSTITTIAWSNPVSTARQPAPVSAHSTAPVTTETAMVKLIVTMTTDGQITDPRVTTVNWRGEVIKEDHPETDVVEYQYNVYGQLYKTLSPVMDHTICQVHNQEGNLVYVYKYDGLDRAKGCNNPAGSEDLLSFYLYDDKQRMTDAYNYTKGYRLSKTGMPGTGLVRETFEYDDLNRQIKQNYIYPKIHAAPAFTLEKVSDTSHRVNWTAVTGEFYDIEVVKQNHRYAWQRHC